MDKKVALKIINFLRKNKIGDNTIQMLFWAEARDLWDLSNNINNGATAIVDGIIKICNPNDNSTS